MPLSTGPKSELLIKTKNGPLSISFQKLEDLHQAGKIPDTSKSLSVDNGLTWVTYAELKTLKNAAEREQDVIDDDTPEEGDRPEMGPTQSPVVPQKTEHMGNRSRRVAGRGNAKRALSSGNPSRRRVFSATQIFFAAFPFSNLPFAGWMARHNFVVHGQKRLGNIWLIAACAAFIAIVIPVNLFFDSKIGDLEGGDGYFALAIAVAAGISWGHQLLFMRYQKTIISNVTNPTFSIPLALVIWVVGMIISVILIGLVFLPFSMKQRHTAQTDSQVEKHDVRISQQTQAPGRNPDVHLPMSELNPSVVKDEGSHP